MCSNYKPVTRADRLLSLFGAHRNVDRDPVDVWPLGPHDECSLAIEQLHAHRLGRG